MTTSLKITNGDLTVGPGRSLETVTGKNKLIQDLRLWVLERIGTDSATPSYGSRFDGGMANGTVVPSFIGQVMNERARADIKAEMIELLTRYQKEQFDKLRTETLRYGGKNTFEADEIISHIDSVQVLTPLPDQIVIRATVTTMAKQSLTLIVPLSQTGIR